MFTPLTELFCEIDDFCKLFYPRYASKLLPRANMRRNRPLSMSASEIITILLLFQMSHYRDFKNFYLLEVSKHLKPCFPTLLSYNRFVEVQSRVLEAFCVFLTSKTHETEGLFIIDSSSLKVCHNRRIHRHKTFEGLAKRGHTSVGWFFGFKLHLVINLKGEIVRFCMSEGNVDDRVAADKLLEDLKGMIVGDKGYIGQKLAENHENHGLKIITRGRKNMMEKKLNPLEKALLAVRGLVETVIDQLKFVCQIEHSRHRKPENFLINLLAALKAYDFKCRKPTANLNQREIKKLIALIPN
jgi:hypothetical protein